MPALMSLQRMRTKVTIARPNFACRPLQIVVIDSLIDDDLINHSVCRD